MSIERAAPQVDELLINANGDISRFGRFGLKVVSDPAGDFPGPLAGILSATEWTRQNRPEAGWLVSFACDCPFLPRDLVRRLVAAAQNSAVQVAVASSGSRRHPVFAAWSTDLPLETEDILHSRGLRKVDDLIDAFPNTDVEFAMTPIDPFLQYQHAGRSDPRPKPGRQWSIDKCLKPRCSSKIRQMSRFASA